MSTARLVALAVFLLACSGGPKRSSSPEPVSTAPVEVIARGGKSVDLDDYIVPGKVTVFDFYATWCEPCHFVDRHMRAVVEQDPDVVLRKLDVVDWGSPLAKRYLSNVPGLPYVEVYGKDGRRVARIAGLHLDKLDRAISKAKGE